MIRLVRFFVERYVFALSIFVAIVSFGLSAALRLGIDLLPEFEIPIVAVNTTYPGAGSAETAEQLSEPIEDAIATIPGVTDISSFSGEGFSFVIAQFSDGTDVDQARSTSSSASTPSRRPARRRFGPYNPEVRSRRRTDSQPRPVISGSAPGIAPTGRRRDRDRRCSRSSGWPTWP